jgi:hypothetical protein
MQTDQAIQEIKDCFARFGSGDYQPSDDEKRVIETTLAEIFRQYNQPLTESGELVATLRREETFLVLDFKMRLSGVKMTRDQAYRLAEELMKFVDAE